MSLANMKKDSEVRMSMLGKDVLFKGVDTNNTMSLGKLEQFVSNFYA